jgi:hypothetical protein
MMRIAVSLAALSLFGCAASLDEAGPGPQSAAARAGRDSFNVSMVNGKSSVDRDTVRLDAGPGRAYEVDISGPMCDQLDWTHRIALESTPGSWICVGDQVGQGSIIFRDPTTRRRTSCYIESVRRVPEAPPR